MNKCIEYFQTDLLKKWNSPQIWYQIKNTSGIPWIWYQPTLLSGYVELWKMKDQYNPSFGMVFQYNKLCIAHP